MVECSIGLKVIEKTARMIDELVKDLPKTKSYEFKRKGVVAETEVDAITRTDTSYITTRAVDRDGEIIDPDGIQLDEYRGNPIVLYGHDFDRPTGKCLWIKPSKDGLLAKSLYTERPEKYVGEFLPDFVWAMVQADVLRGKSIGALPVECRDPTPEETALNPNLWNVITKCILLEYSVVSVPSNPTALIETIGKGIGWEHWGFKVIKEAPTPKIKEPKPVKKKPVNIDWTKELKSITLDPTRIADEAVKRILGRWEI